MNLRPEPSERLRSVASIRTRLEAMLDAGAPLEEVLAEIVRLVEGQCHGMLCSVLLVERDASLRLGAAPSLPAAYNALFQNIVVAEGVGSCGTAVYRKELVVTHDIASDPLWTNYKEFALPHGLRACWSNPIWSGTQIVGTFASYYAEPRSPSVEELEIVQIAGELASAAIQRVRLGTKSTNAKRRILIVEDDHQFRELVVEFLKLDGYDIREAADGRSALSICNEELQRIDLVLTDVEMPGMNGCMLAAELARLHPHTAVLFMSASPQSNPQISATMFLEKPFTRDSLRRKLSFILRNDC